MDARCVARCPKCGQDTMGQSSRLNTNGISRISARNSRSFHHSCIVCRNKNNHVTEPETADRTLTKTPTLDARNSAVGVEIKSMMASLVNSSRCAQPEHSTASGVLSSFVFKDRRFLS